MADIAMGNVDLTDELLEGKEEFFTAEELEAGEHRNKDKLDGYYLTVLKKSPELVKQITPADEPILKHITYVEPIVYADKDDYAVKFHFSANEWFTNSTLEVTVVTDTEGNATEIKSDVITWAEGKDVTSKTVTKKQKNKRTGQARTTTKTEKIDSFFRIFESLEVINFCLDLAKCNIFALKHKTKSKIRIQVPTQKKRTRMTRVPIWTSMRNSKRWKV
jgi:nucleosome assembly protein 1-like 1